MQDEWIIHTFCKQKLMKAYLDNYIGELLSLGRYCFTRKELGERFDVGDIAIRQCLQRLVRSGTVCSIRNGFYIIVPPEYRSRGILSAEMFIDDFMQHLGRPYYVGLLSAAALHGAAHQQPQSFTTLVAKPAVRPIRMNGMNLVFPVKSIIPATGIEQKKSAAGYFRVSSPELTALDLLAYLRQVGGVTAIISVLEELAELLDKGNLARVAKEATQTSSLQRLGYILDEVLGEKGLASVVLAELRNRNCFHIPLAPSVESHGCPISKPWKVRINVDLEGEL